MLKTSNKKIFATTLVILMMFLLCLSACNKNPDSNVDTNVKTSENKINTSADLNGHPIVTVVGSAQEKLTFEHYPDSEISYNPDFATCVLSVETNKADFTIMPECQYEACKNDHLSVTGVYPALANTKVYFAAARNEISNRYLEEINEYINELDEKGELTPLVNKWSDPEYNNYFDYSELIGENGTLYYASGVYDRPYFFQTKDVYGGVEAEILYGFAKKHGYKIDISILEISSALAGLATDHFNLTGTLVYTQERAESVDYSIEYAEVNQIAVCRLDLLNDIPMYRDTDALENKKVAVCTGMYEDELVYNYLPDSEYSNFSSFDDCLAALSSGEVEATLVPQSQLSYAIEKYDNLAIQQKEIAFDNNNEPIYCLVRKVQTSSDDNVNFLNKIAIAFEKNFIREDRWKMLLDGLKVTIEITLLTALFGTLFGVILCALRRSNIKLVNSVTKTFVRIMQGVPIVVMLLVLYYVIFAKSTMSGVAVGVIGFSLDFGVYVSEILRSGIEAVDVGQWEAASALGFNKIKTYIYIVMPQAIRHALPVYKGQFISMVKMTSVVGYVAVQDLTKVSDIIRSRTYDAFMPIVTTAIIYFLLAWVLTSLLSFIEIKTDPNKRKNMLDGINIDIAINKHTGFVKNKTSNKKEELIRIEHLRKEYSNAIPLKDVSTTVKRGDVISIIGPSGTGKSTLIRMINRLEEPTSGDVYAFGKLVNSKSKDIYSLRANMGMVFQSFNLFNHLTVIENLMVAPVVIKGVSRQEAYENGMYLLKRVGLSEKALNYPNELSGGQKQRVAIIRTLSMDPEIMLLDEPTSALDPAMINEVLHVIEDLVKAGMTMMIVTHELKFAQKVANRVFYMDEGGIYEEGSSEKIFNNPSKEKTKAFVRRLKIFTLDIDSPDFDFINLRSKLETFGYQQMIQGRTNNSMVLCTEELFTFAMANLEKDCFPANITIECDEEGTLKIIFKYQGKKRNIVNEMDSISKNIVKSLTNSLDYSYSKEQGNVISFIIK